MWTEGARDSNDDVLVNPLYRDVGIPKEQDEGAKDRGDLTKWKDYQRDHEEDGTMFSGYIRTCLLHVVEVCDHHYDRKYELIDEGVFWRRNHG